MKVLYFISIVFLGVSCQGIKDSSDSDESSTANFIGKWTSTPKVIPYSGFLTIKNDQTFSFNYGACDHGGFSRGVWSLNGDTLILNNSIIDTCYYITEFGINCIAIPESEEDLPELKTTIPNCKPESLDIDFVLFENECFLLINDTLSLIPNEGCLCPEESDKFTLEKNTTANMRYN